jgi:NAD(P)-dependent dehydrogenase (short-subunit alcohol dehydrogenase family)
MSGSSPRQDTADLERKKLMDLGIQGLRVLITAGASGIGLEIARSFVREGARVHLCDVNDAALASLEVSDLNVTWSLADVASRSDVARLFDEALYALGGLDVLINNAGVAGPTARVDEVDPEDWDRTLQVNITGQFNCARLAVRHLRESGNPSIINLSSAAGRFGFPLRSPYSASKWAVVGFTKTLAMELGPLGIRVNAILPGVVEGDRIRHVIESKAQARGISFEEMQDEFLRNVSMRTAVTPQQIADQIVFLCSPKGRTISGQAIAIDGDTQSLA